MNRFQRVIAILDDAVGGSTAPVGFHGAFWRGVSRNDFVTMRVFGLELVSVGNGAGSNLVRALKTDTPFGADTGNPEASFNRIRLINLQGEGSNRSPEETPGDLAHYYRFGEIHHGKRFVQGSNGRWGYTGDDVPLPDVHDMSEIPAGGYQLGDVPDPAVWEMITRFDQDDSEMLRLLERAWTHGNQSSLSQAIGRMFALHSNGRQLVTKPKPDGQGNYGPCYRFVP